MQGVQDTVCKTLGLPIRPLIAPDDFSIAVSRAITVDTPCT
jgi:hypothetical protein